MKSRRNAVDFMHAVSAREQQVRAYLLDPRFRQWFRSEHLAEGVVAYLTRPAKRLRPVVLMLSCGAVGGNECQALPAAAGVELFHTWTLVHDDVIDNDELRRNGPTIHRMFAERLAQRGAHSSWAADYGRDVAILVGDSQHAWSLWALLETASRAPEMTAPTLKLAQHLESVVINRLIEGEILDVEFTREGVEELSRETIIDMLYLKTGALYEYAALAGASLGLRETDWSHPWIMALSDFARQCGTAFQLQDDILGVVGDQAQLGKPVGSDIREGKRTTITYYAFQAASPEQRRRLESWLGNKQASEQDMLAARDLLVELGGVRETAAIARELTEQAIPKLDVLPDSEYKDLLREWAHFLVERAF